MAVPISFGDAKSMVRNGADLLLTVAAGKHAAAALRTDTNEANIARAKSQRWTENTFDQRAAARDPTK